MDWLPPVADFQKDLRAASQVADAEDRFQRLAALAQHRLDFVQTIQLGRVLDQVAREGIRGLEPVRLAVLASSTVDHLAPALRVAGLRRRLLLELRIGPYGQYRQELLGEASSLREFRPHFVLLSLTAREMLATTPIDCDAPEIGARVHRHVEELRALWAAAGDGLGSTVLQQTFLNVADPLFGSYDRIVPGAPARVIAELNERLATAAAEHGVLLIDVARASERTGLDAWFDEARWLQGKLEIAPQAAPRYGELVARVIAACRGLSRKCLVLDLDNTLWGGVIGDDGIAGITLGEGNAQGEAHLGLQRYAKQLRERGVILAVCSKNDAAIAEAVFRDHPEMVLKRSDFAAFMANWDDKVENLKRIATELNIGIDSLVFVDDNPAERERVRQSLPTVAVPELPADVAHYVRCLADAGYFEAVSFTADDRRRGEQYAANASRESFQQSSQSLDEFLRGLEMSVRFGPIQDVDLARTAQLVAKTNQFNPTTRRYSAQEIAAIAGDERCLALQFRLADRFGDNGLVSVMLLRPDPEDGAVLDIDAWVMSCRVFGRQLEAEAMSIAVEVARRRGVRAFRADYIPTDRNKVVSELYPSLGFVCAERAPQERGMRWRLQLAEYVAARTHIARATSQ